MYVLFKMIYLLRCPVCPGIWSLLPDQQCKAVPQEAHEIDLKMSITWNLFTLIHYLSFSTSMTVPQSKTHAQCTTCKQIVL